MYAKKGTGIPTVSYDDAVEEALCFGWIDSRVNRVDDLRYRQVFTPRRPGSIWSRPNKQRVERVTAAGAMTPAGAGKVEAAKRDGSWDLLDLVDDLVMPDDLESALVSAGARPGFDTLPVSERKQLLYWVRSARRDATREQRVAEVVRRSLR